MLAIFLKTLPFFALIGLGYWACRTRFFTEEAAAYLTKFVFYFALSAMLFRFAATLNIRDLFDVKFASAYLVGCFAVYLFVTLIARWRGLGMADRAFEAQCAVIGNTGFLGVPMLIALLGPEAAGPVLVCLAIDLIVFSSLIVILITVSKEGKITTGSLRIVGLSLLKNPMIVSMGLGLAVSIGGVPVPAPVDEFLSILGSAATPGALFAIGASLAVKSGQRVAVSIWLSFAKLILHPIAVAISALWIFSIEPFAATVMIAVSALPVAGNVYILAQHFGVAVQKVSATILLSTIISVATVSIAIALLTQ